MRGWLAIGLLILTSTTGCGGQQPPRAMIGKDIELSLDRACVVAGQEQSLKVRAKPNSVAIFEAEYSDGKSGAPEPFGGGYGGNDSEIVPKSGVVEMRWSVSRDAPPGPVVVDVGVLEETRREKDLKFTLVSPTDSC